MGKAIVNQALLDEKIKLSGLKKGYIVEQIGISRNGFDKKCKGKTPFRGAEIYVLCDLLNISDSEKSSIFFAN